MSIRPLYWPRRHVKLNKTIGARADRFVLNFSSLSFDLSISRYLSIIPSPQFFSPPPLNKGFYRGGKFVFSFKVGQAYPHEPPKVKCETQVYHPNIDLEGNICLNILREDWKPVLTINSIIYGLQYLFLEPNPEDPLNKEAAEVLQSNRRVFEQNVQKSMRGGYVGNNYFERCLLK